MGVELEIPPEEGDLLVSVKKKIRVPLDEKYADFPMQSVYEYLKTHVLAEIVELEGVLIEFKDIKIKSVEKKSPKDTHAKVKGIFTVLKIEPGRSLQAKFLSAGNGVLICSGFGLAVHIKDKNNIGQLIAVGTTIQYKFSRFHNENGFLILYGKKPKLFGVEGSSMDTGGETQTEDEVASPKKRKKEDGESSPNKRLRPEENGEVSGSSKAKKTPQTKSAVKRDEIPEGYKKEEYFSAANPKRKYFKITAPDGKTFTTIKKAREYFYKANETSNNTDNQADVTMANDDANNTVAAPKKESAKKTTKDVTTKLNFDNIPSDDDFKPEQNNTNKKTPAKKKKDKDTLVTELKEIETPAVEVEKDETPAKKKKGANTPGKNVIPEGYIDLSTPSAANPKKKLIKIQAPDGKKFSTIKAAQEYYAKSMQDKDNSGEEVVEKEDEIEDNESNTEDSDVDMEKHSDNEPVAEESMVVEKKTPKKAVKTPARNEIPEGYKDLSSVPNEKGKRKIKIQAPDGKTFKSIRAAQEYFAKSLEEDKNESEEESDEKEREQEESDIEQDENERDREKESDSEESSIDEGENKRDRARKIESDDEQEQEDDKSEVDEIDDKTPAKKEVKKRSRSKKGANTPGRNKIPEGYTDLSTPSAANPKKKNIKIQAPDGKKFSTIKAAQEYFAKSHENAKSEQENEENSEEEEKDDTEHETKTVDSDVESDGDSDVDESMVVEITPVEKTTEGQTPKSDKKKKTGLKLGQIPEGYTDMSTPKPEGGGKRKIKIQAPNGKTFSTIKKAQEYYMKSMQTKETKSVVQESSVTKKNTETKKEKRKMYTKEDLPRDFIYTPPEGKGKLKIETPSGKIFRSIKAAMEHFEEQKKEENSEGEHKEEGKEEGYESDASESSNLHHDGLPTPYQLPKSQEEGTDGENEVIPARKQTKKMEVDLPKEKKKEEKNTKTDVEPNYVSDSDAESDFSTKNNSNYFKNLSQNFESSQKNSKRKKNKQNASHKKNKINEPSKKAETPENDLATNEEPTKTSNHELTDLKKSHHELSTSPKKSHHELPISTKKSHHELPTSPKKSHHELPTSPKKSQNEMPTSPKSHHELPTSPKKSHHEIPTSPKKNHHEQPASPIKNHHELPISTKKNHHEQSESSKKSNHELPVSSKKNHQELPVSPKKSHHELPESPKKNHHEESAPSKKKNIFSELTLKNKSAMVKSSPKRPVLEDSDDELDNLELDSDDNFQASPTKKRKLSTSVAVNGDLSSRQDVELNNQNKTNKTNPSFEGDAALDGESTGQDESQDDTAESNLVQRKKKKKDKKKKSKKSKHRSFLGIAVEGFM